MFQITADHTDETFTVAYAAEIAPVLEAMHHGLTDQTRRDIAAVVDMAIELEDGETLGASYYATRALGIHIKRVADWNATSSETVTYPEGTRLGDIATFDSTQKVTFECGNGHRIGAWRSKDPFVSTWFPADGNEMADESACTCPTGALVTLSPYTVEVKTYGFITDSQRNWEMTGH